MSSRLPKLVAFDLDYTLWPLWIDTHVDAPLKRNGQELNKVVDRYGQEVSFYPQVPHVLHRLRASGVIVASCSRTSAPDLASSALNLLLVPPKKGDKNGVPTRAADFFDQNEIYPGSKITHFKQLHKKTKIPYSEMLFFDDEHRNSEVESLGITFVLVRKGVDERPFEQGLAEWRRRHPEEVVEDPAGDDVRGV
ncbi:magnesium-dependent phosphatase-1 [Stereum hirsutum FP-91666 SS1]|uniref:magnesium-dependent phosphatase-1 n=1 Tax=Stereum hirsutum (strain FP-91666) TaxID=721885 RepID=UPI0004449EAB|nr:magnesium-dependent phosphatase-1 [Stereum hirsutum FP-91666 SS1]EIM85112.1 magnesium-dependent phosphatase-1 [Stereum hirsutum FP-91666 SS1]